MGYSKSLYQAIHKDTLVKYLMSRDRKIKSLQKQIDDLKQVVNQTRNKHQDFLNLL